MFVGVYQDSQRIWPGFLATIQLEFIDRIGAESAAIWDKNTGVLRQTSQIVWIGECGGGQDEMLQA
jgi:hypothetical protein